MKKEKSEWDLLYVWPAFAPVVRFKGKMYVEIRDFECCVRDIQRELENISELNRKQSKAFKETMKDYRELMRDYMKLEEENKKLKEEREMLIEDLSSDKELQQQIAQKQVDYYRENQKLKEENKKLRFELWESQTHRWVDVKDLKNKIEQQKSALKKMEKTNKNLKEELRYYKEKTDFLNKVIVKYQEENED